MPLSLFALAVAAFGIGTTEFAVMGLLPGIAADLGIAIPAAGHAVTAYAAGVVAGAPLMAVATNGLPRRAALLLLVAIFVAGNAASAAAPDTGTLFAARVLTAFCHGAFFGIAAVVATRLVPPGRAARAVAIVFAGLTVANILGVPGGVLLGEALGWRAVFAAIAGIGCLAFAAIAAWLPADLAAPRGNLAAEFLVLGRPKVILAMAVTVLTSAALFTVFTFIAPLLREVAGLSPAGVSAAILLFGIGMTAGSFAGGRLADWRLMPSMVGVIAMLTLVFAFLGAAAGSASLAVAAMPVLGLVIFTLAAPLQIRVVEAASEAPNVASTLNQAAFNLGNAGGAVIGAAMLEAGFGYADLPFAAIGLALLGLAVALVSWRLDGPAGIGAVLRSSPVARA